MVDDEIVIDGSAGEGGGQVLRSSLALSLVTGRALRIHDIRGRRAKPGLMRQHLVAVRAAAEVSGARVEGDELRSSALWLRPGPVRAGEYRFAIGTAGSTTLVLQTVLWPLLLAPGRSRLVLEGGTHNPLAPPFEFIEHGLLPALRAMGARVEITLERAGFNPAGGGRLVVEIDGGAPLRPLHWLDDVAITQVGAVALHANLRVSIARRELGIVGERLGWSPGVLKSERIESDGPGNVVVLRAAHQYGSHVVVGFGERGVMAETVAEAAAKEMEELLAAKVPVGPHLADQLLVPLALAGGGSFRTLEPTLHTRTNAELIGRWLPVSIELQPEPSGTWRVDVHGATK